MSLIFIFQVFAARPSCLHTTFARQGLLVRQYTLELLLPGSRTGLLHLPYRLLRLDVLLGEGNGSSRGRGGCDGLAAPVGVLSAAGHDVDDLVVDRFGENEKVERALRLHKDYRA